MRYWVIFRWNLRQHPEKGEELPLEELGSALGVGYSGALGKYMLGLVLRMAEGECLADSTSHRSNFSYF